MSTDAFDYDLAISFLARDEAIATQLVDQFEGRLRVFLYSQRQEQLAGTDGEKTFNEVFSRQARLVVVLYRSGWGETAWTRIEETAIRNRAYEQGYDFVLFIPLDDPPSVPVWLPKTRLWIGLKRWGVAGAASVIDARYQEIGGTPIEESIDQRAARLEREVAFTKARERYLSSELGVQQALEAYMVTANEIERRVKQLQYSAPSLGLELKRNNNILVALTPNLSLRVRWCCHYSNTLDESHLEVSLWKVHPPFPNIVHYGNPESVTTKTFLADVLPTEQACWVDRGERDKPPLLPEPTAEAILNWWLDRALKDQRAMR